MNQSTDTLLHQLAESLSQPLPGKSIQYEMAPEGREMRQGSIRDQASVLIAIYRENSHWTFPLIHRVEDGHAHSGQISLPGGKIEEGEQPVTAALREANEEVGIEPSKVRIIGQLTPLHIPVSGYYVYPFVGYIPEKPHWKLNFSELQSIRQVSLDELCNNDTIKNEVWTLGNLKRQVSFFELQGEKVWGATAMILNEFRTILMNMSIQL